MEGTISFIVFSLQCGSKNCDEESSKLASIQHKIK
jgi:hypothetical protein